MQPLPLRLRRSSKKAAAQDDGLIPFESVYVASNLTDTAATINAKLDQGLHVVVSGGIYQIEEPLRLHTEGQVLLGIGMATLISAAGNTVIDVADVDGVRVAGLLIDAGESDTTHLVKWGEEGSKGDHHNPGVISDVFVRYE